jgi:tetratricopeptide (TPR) repeat protein
MHCLNPQCAMNENGFEKHLCDNCRKWADRELKVKPGSAEERFSFAESLLLHGRFTEAIAAYREAISQAPHEPLYHHRLVQALSMDGQENEIVPDLKAALALGDGIHSWNYASGISYLLYDLKLAEAGFAKMIALSKNLQKAHKLIGQAYREILHDVKRASWHYKEYLRLGGDDQDVVEWMISRDQIE